MQTKRQIFWGATGALFLLALFSSGAHARMMVIDTVYPTYSKLAGITTLPNLEQCTHRTGRFWFTVSNYGVFGNGRDALLPDCLTGGFTSSAEFPGGSNVEYLFRGALWIGGIVGNDTLTSIGTDGWVGIREFFPDEDAKGSIIKRSSRATSPYYSADAISDLDLIAVYYDTLRDPRLVTTPDPENGRPHKPMGLKVEQRSYSWATEWGQDWVLLDFSITNGGVEPISKAYFGFFFDADVGNRNSGKATHLDDYTGFLRETFHSLANGYYFPPRPPNSLICTETLNIAYVFDNYGDPESDKDFASAGALGIRFLRAKQAIRLFTFPAKLSYNWWIPDNLGTLDWGPQRTPGRTNIYWGRGQPIGDEMKYYYLSNQDVDYDQIASAVKPGLVDTLFDMGFQTGWLPPLEPLTSAIDIADGADTRFLLSTGPFDLEAGESIPLTIAVFVGPRFHTDPANYSTNFGSPADFLDPARIREYRSHLDVRGLVESSRLARRVFDNENVRSPILCNIPSHTFDSARVHGDGIPDFKGPAPPPFPQVQFFADEGEVTIRWFGRETEEAIDPITNHRDFEGYSIQMSPDGTNYTFIGYFDRVNWKPYFLNRDLNGDGIQENWEYRWEPSPTPPLTYEEIQRTYALRWDTCANKPGNITKPIDPEKYNTAIQLTFPQPFIPAGNPWCNPDTTKTAVRVRFCDNCGYAGQRVDTVFYFQPEGGLNLGLDPIRMYPSVTDPNNDSAYWYQYKISGLFPSQPIWLAVVPFDNGLKTFYQEIKPQSALPYAGAQLVYPIASDSARKEKELKVSVYPNPYRIDHDYRFFEKKYPVTGHPQSSQRINFVNLPPRCVIRIYTLDGDLVQQINHDKDPNASDSGYDFWDLLTRNAQKVVAGMYIFSVESSEGRYIGKILIIQ